MEKKTRSSARTLRRKNKKSNSNSNLKISKTRLENPLPSQIVNTLFDLNYELHHATILDNNDLAALEAKNSIEKNIDLFAFMSTKIPSKETITMQEAVDKMKRFNESIFQKTKTIVEKYGRNHYSGNNKKENMNKIMFIVTVKNDISKFLIREISREDLFGACRMEDDQITTQEEKNDVLNALTYYFKGIPFNRNGLVASISDAYFAAFVYVKASPLVRKWVEGHIAPFGITLELDLEQNTTNILCSSVDDWFRINNLYQFKVQ